METGNLLKSGKSDEQKKHRLSFFAEWMKKLAAAYRQEISLETQSIYIEQLSDLPLDRLDEAFKGALRNCKFLPTISEIRDFEVSVSISNAAAYERMKARVLAQPEIPTFASIRDQKGAL